jgi:hypothetical protein
MQAKFQSKTKGMNFKLFPTHVESIIQHDYRPIGGHFGGLADTATKTALVNG